jgi:hypothetical protein
MSQRGLKRRQRRITQKWFFQEGPKSISSDLLEIEPAEGITCSRCGDNDENPETALSSSINIIWIKKEEEAEGYLCDDCFRELLRNGVVKDADVEDAEVKGEEKPLPPQIAQRHYFYFNLIGDHNYSWTWDHLMIFAKIFLMTGYWPEIEENSVGPVNSLELPIYWGYENPDFENLKTCAWYIDQAVGFQDVIAAHKKNGCPTIGRNRERRFEEVDLYDHCICSYYEHATNGLLNFLVKLAMIVMASEYYCFDCSFRKEWENLNIPRSLSGQISRDKKYREEPWKKFVDEFFPGK